MGSSDTYLPVEMRMAVPVFTSSRRIFALIILTSLFDGRGFSSIALGLFSEGSRSDEVGLSSIKSSLDIIVICLIDKFFFL